MNILSKLFVALSLIIIPGSYSFAQNTEIGVGHISGKLMGNMEALAGAEVVLMHKDQLIDKTITDENGHYSFKYINPDKYDVRATKTGYRTCVIVHVPVTADRTTQNDFYLPQYKSNHSPANPIVDNYENNCRTYMRQGRKNKSNRL